MAAAQIAFVFMSVRRVVAREVQPGYAVVVEPLPVVGSTPT